MEKCYFVYTVDAVTIEGENITIGMIMDRAELLDAIDESGDGLQRVTVALYDSGGQFISERDITRLFGLKTA